MSTVSDVPVREHLAYNYASCATIGKYNNNIDSFLITRSAVVILTAGNSVCDNLHFFVTVMK